MSKKPASAAELQEACEGWKEAVYMGCPVPGRPDQVEVDTDKFTAATDTLISLIVGADGRSAPEIPPLTKMKNRVLRYVRTGKAMSFEEYLDLRSEADTAVNVLKESPRGHGTGRSGKQRRGPGRPVDTNPKADERIFDAWQTRRYKRYADLAQELQTTKREVVAAIDRHRKRLKRKGK